MPFILSFWRGSDSTSILAPVHATPKPQALCTCGSRKYLRLRAIGAIARRYPVCDGGVTCARAKPRPRPVEHGGEHRWPIRSPPSGDERPGQATESCARGHRNSATAIPHHCPELLGEVCFSSTIARRMPTGSRHCSRAGSTSKQATQPNRLVQDSRCNSSRTERRSAPIAVTAFMKSASARPKIHLLGKQPEPASCLG